MTMAALHESKAVISRVRVSISKEVRQQHSRIAAVVCAEEQEEPDCWECPQSSLPLHRLPQFWYPLLP